MKLLSASFFTTVSFSQAAAALSFFLPWNWNKINNGCGAEKLEQSIKEITKTNYARSFYNGRGALYHGLQAIGIGDGDEVIIQAFTCVSVPNAIISLKARPVYADIDDTLNIKPEKIEDKINFRTKAIIVQHTFGCPADLGKIIELAKKHSIILVEDCAHSLGAEYNGRPVGSFGKFAIFSFGRDKVISSVNGGMLATNDQGLFNKLPKKLPLPKLKIIIQNLFYPTIAFKSRLFYNFFNLGKITITLAKKLGHIPEITSAKENNCNDGQILKLGLPNALAELALKELKMLNCYNCCRIELARYYYQNLNCFFKTIFLENSNNRNIYMRFCLIAENKEEIYSRLKKKGIVLGNWYDSPVAPKKTKLENALYELGSCPIAENFSRKCLNLPNHSGITLKDAEKIVKELKK